MKLQAIPVVPWNSDQSVVHLYPTFMLLLHKLGFHLPADSGNAFVRIPAFWTADILFNVAQKLGPVSQCECGARVPLGSVRFEQN